MRVASALLLALLLSAPALAQEVGPNDFRITFVGTDGETDQQAQDPAVAHGTVANEYLAVFEADTTNGLFEVMGQRVSAAGTRIGDEFPISSVTAVATADAFDPAVAYNPVTNQFLVVWYADPATGGLVDNENEIYGQLVAASGTLVGSNFRISNVGTDGDTNTDAAVPSVVFNPVSNEFLVVFESDGRIDNRFEVHGRRVSAAGVVQGAADIVISTNGDPASGNYDASDPDVAFAGTATAAPGGYLVVWRSDDNRTPQIDNEYEIFAEYLDATGATVGTGDVRISDAGADGVTTAVVNVPTVACTATGTCLVVWHGDDPQPPVLDNENEVFGQLLAPDGTETGTNDFRISNMGTDGNANIDVADADVAHNPTQNNFLVIWESDSDVAPVIDGETEIFGEYVDLTGATQGTGDLRISDLGTDGNGNFDAFNSAVAFNLTSNEFLAVWYGDDDTPPAVSGESEIWGQRMRGTPLTTAAEPMPAGAAYRVTAPAPNPLATRAALAVEVADAQRVTVEVLDALGRRVATVFDGALAAGSARELALDGSALAPGAYVVVVRGEHFVEALRVTVAR